MVELVEPGRLTLGCANLDAPPLFSRADAEGMRTGYEPSAAELVCSALGLGVRWVFLAWADFYPVLHEGRVDAVWCGQGITPARRELADFSRPYAVFDESLVVRADNPVSHPDELAGQRIGAIAASTNMALAETFPGAELVAFPGTADVLGDMIASLRAGEIDGFVDDDVVMAPLDADPGLRLAFTLPTRNRWGVAVRRGDDAMRLALDEALDAVTADGSLRAAWERWLTWLAFPLPA